MHNTETNIPSGWGQEAEEEEPLLQVEGAEEELPHPFQEEGPGVELVRLHHTSVELVAASLEPVAMAETHLGQIHW